MKKKVIILSETTGIEIVRKELTKMQIDLKYSPAYKIKHVEHVLKKADNNNVAIIFQSKNSVKHSKNIIQPFIDGGDVTMYAVGKYSSDEAMMIYKCKCIYPENNYSSESLIELLKSKKERHHKFIIIKGEGGRNIIKEFLDSAGKDVISLDVYKRIIKKDFFIEEDMIINSENWLLLSSKELLEKVNDRIKSFRQKFKIGLIIPSKRLINKEDECLYNLIKVLPNSISSPEIILSIVNKGIINE